MALSKEGQLRRLSSAAVSNREEVDDKNMYQ